MGSFLFQYMANYLGNQSAILKRGKGPAQASPIRIYFVISFTETG